MLKKRWMTAVFFFLFIGISGIVYGIYAPSPGEEESSGTSWEWTEEDVTAGEETVSEQYSVLAVYICGEVRSPGVYELEAGERLDAAVALAGGLTDEAAAGQINLAALLEDGERYYIPSVQEEEEGYTEERADSGLVNINRADAAQLMTLPGIGAAKADSIIAFREKNGKFTSIEDLCQVDGIKEGVLSAIRDRITVK